MNVDLVQIGSDLIYFLITVLGKAVFAPLISGSELYWLYWVAAFIISWGVWRIFLMKFSTNALGFRGNFFSKKIWLHPSAITDYKFYFINALIMAWLINSIWLDPSAIKDILSNFFQLKIIDNPSSKEGGVAIKVVYTILFFVIYDFGKFVAHSLLHDVELLWKFHQVHHSAEVLTPLTAYRVHAVDLAIMAWVPMIFTATLTWIFEQWAGSGIGFYAFMGFHVIIWFFNFIDHLRHWHVWVSYGEVFNNWLISPAHHQLHHSADPRHWGCNRGYELAIWDRWYGTLVLPDKNPPDLTFGLHETEKEKWKFQWQLQLRPFIEAVKCIRFGYK